MAIIASLSLAPYNYLAPKKIFLQHLHEHGPAGDISRSVFAVGAVDSVPIDSFFDARLSNVSSAEETGWEWQVSLTVLIWTSLDLLQPRQ